MGWEPTRTVTYLCDEYGVRTGERVEVEPEFDDDDRAWFLALAEIEDECCPGCGMPRDETLGVYPTEFIVDPPWRCGACDALERARHDYRDTDNPSALTFPVRRRRGR